MLFDPIDAPLCLWVLHQLREEFKFKYENRVFLLHPVFWCVFIGPLKLSVKV